MKKRQDKEVFLKGVTQMSNYPNNAWDVIKDLTFWEWLAIIGIPVLIGVGLYYWSVNLV